MQIDTQDIKTLLALLKGGAKREHIIAFIENYIWAEKPKCDTCGKPKRVGQHGGKMICQDCWAETLTDEEINNL